MDNHELTERVFLIGERISAHDQEIKTLFNQQKNIEKLAESTHELAQSVKELTVRINTVDDRLELIENEKKQKNFAIWQIVMSAVIGGVATYIISNILK